MKWYTASTIHDIQNQPPKEMLAWLICAPRLTQQLKAQTTKHQLKVIKQEKAMMAADTADLLQMPTHSTCWTRTIVHYDDEQPLVAAKVIVPVKTYEAYTAQLEGLENQSIGDALLFNDNRVKRSDFSIGLVDKDHTEYGFAFDYVESDTTLWARTSTFHWLDHVMLITELFLPNVPNLETSKKTQAENS